MIRYLKVVYLSLQLGTTSSYRLSSAPVDDHRGKVEAREQQNNNRFRSREREFGHYLLAGFLRMELLNNLESGFKK